METNKVDSYSFFYFYSLLHYRCARDSPIVEIRERDKEREREKERAVMGLMLIRYLLSFFHYTFLVLVNPHPSSVSIPRLPEEMKGYQVFTSSISIKSNMISTVE